MGKLPKPLCRMRWDIGYLMAFTLFHKGRDSQAENNTEIYAPVCDTTTFMSLLLLYCRMLVVLECSFQGRGWKALLPSLLGHSWGATLGWILMSHVLPGCRRDAAARVVEDCQRAEQPTGQTPPDCEGGIVCQHVLLSSPKMTNLAGGRHVGHDWNHLVWGLLKSKLAMVCDVRSTLIYFMVPHFGGVTFTSICFYCSI